MLAWTQGPLAQRRPLQVGPESRLSRPPLARAHAPTGTNCSCPSSSPCLEPAGPCRHCSFSEAGMGRLDWALAAAAQASWPPPWTRTDCVFNVLNIEQVQIFFCSALRHVPSLVREYSQGLNILKMQLTLKMAFVFLIMFHFSISC